MLSSASFEAIEASTAARRVLRLASVGAVAAMMQSLLSVHLRRVERRRGYQISICRLCVLERWGTRWILGEVYVERHELERAFSRRDALGDGPSEMRIGSELAGAFRKNIRLFSLGSFCQPDSFSSIPLLYRRNSKLVDLVI